MCEAAFQINERQWAVKELHPKESPCTFLLMHSIITDLTSHKIWILWEQMKALNHFNFHWHSCNSTSCSELLGSQKPKAEKKINPSKLLHFCHGSILCTNENLPVTNTMNSTNKEIQLDNTYFICSQFQSIRLPSGAKCKYCLFFSNSIWVLKIVNTM